MITVDLPEYRQKHIVRLWFISHKSAQTIASELAVTPAQVFVVISNELSVRLARFRSLKSFASIRIALIKAETNADKNNEN